MSSDRHEDKESSESVPETEENPVTTLYRNVRDMSRREYLALVGGGLAGVLGWTTDVDGDGMSNGEEMLQGRNPVGTGGSGGNGGGGTAAETTVRDRALEVAEREYPEYRERVESFIADDVADRFIDRQLALWLDADPFWQPAIIEAEDGFYMDDWTKNGLHHLEPDGSEGPAYENPFVVNPDGDAFMPGFYNATGKVHDIVSGGYNGFQPATGDKVGKLGDANGEGSIASYLDGNISRDQLNGRAMTVVWHDWMEGTSNKGPSENEPYNGRLEPDTRQIVENELSEAPKSNPDGSEGIDLYWIDGEQLPHEPDTTPAEAQRLAQDHIPRELIGPVNYALVVHDIYRPEAPEGNTENPTGLKLLSEQITGGYWEVTTRSQAENNDYSRAQINASLLLHEVYGHGVGDLPHPTDEDAETVMQIGYASTDFRQDEWNTIFRKMAASKREYTQMLV